MSWPHIAIYAVAGCIGLPAMFRNPTAAGLVLSWMLGEVTWMMTGNNLPLSVYFMADVAVITIIYAKMIWRVGPKTYPSAWLHFKCFILDLTVCDRIIVGIFLLGAWPAYVIELDPYYKWWLLYWLTVAQFVLAGAEALSSWLRRRNDPPKVDRLSADIIPFAPRFGAEPISAFRSDTQLPSSGGGGAQC